MNFICPICSQSLNILEGGTALCQKGHSFDRAKEGYYNLLIRNAGGVHGDNKEMIEARRAFLNTGAYKPLCDAVASLALKYTDGGILLDSGCGEGYYTDAICRAVEKDCRDVRVLGFDISKDAVRRAAKRNSSLSLAVASAYDIPIADSSVSTVINVFSPLAIAETHRVLKPSGIFIMAIPDKRHLFELKAEIYDTPYENEVKDTVLEGFSLVSEQRISYDMHFEDKESVRSLFMMTPYAYRTSKEGRERILSLSSLTTKAQFIIFTYKKN